MTFTRTLCATKLARIYAVAGVTTTGVYNTSAMVQRLTAGVFVTLLAQTAVPCEFERSQISPQENMSQTARLYIDDRWIFKMPLATTVRFQDRLVVGDRTFEVIHVNRGSGSVMLEVLTHELANLD